MIFLTSQYKLNVKKLISPSFKWATDGQIASRIDGWNKAADSIIKEAETKGEVGTVKRVTELKEALAKGDRKGIGAAAEKVKRLGGLPGAVGKEIAGHAGNLPSKVFSGENIGKSIKLGISFLILAAIGMILLKAHIGKFIIGFPIIFFLAWLSNFIAGNALATDLGVEYVVYALALGLLISNTVGVPEWLKPAVQTEYYIKTGLVILDQQSCSMRYFRAAPSASFRGFLLSLLSGIHASGLQGSLGLMKILPRCLLLLFPSAAFLLLLQHAAR